MNNIRLITIISSFILTIVLIFLLLPMLKKLKYGQVVREEGPKEHYTKNGTPTMGGVAMIIAVIITVLLASLIDTNIKIMNTIFLLLPLLLFGIIGFIDDYLIVVKKSNSGLKPSGKFLMQLISTSIFYYLYLNNGYDTYISLTEDIKIDGGFLYGIYLFIAIVGMSNAVNITDGIDGLATTLLIISFTTLFSASVLKEQYEVTVVILAIIGSLFGFLLFNINPAKIFMGDTGSLALGATLASISLVLGLEIMIILIALVFIIEIISVMLQVWYFKMSDGKRLFKMAPYHHHLEMNGFTEKNIVVVFAIIAVVANIIAVLLIR